MDAQPLFDPKYLPIILATLIGFGILATALLLPIWRFLDRENEVAEQWTEASLAERMKKNAGDGAPASSASGDNSEGDNSEGDNTSANDTEPPSPESDTEETNPEATGGGPDDTER